jgi:hypothetical protein
MGLPGTVASSIAFRSPQRTHANGTVMKPKASTNLARDARGEKGEAPRRGHPGATRRLSRSANQKVTVASFEHVEVPA